MDFGTTGALGARDNFEFFDDDDEDLHNRFDLIQVQRRLIHEMLNLNPHEDDEEQLEVEVGNGQSIDKRILTFKVLILDQEAQNVVAPIMKVGSLRDCNVALHLAMNQKRDNIPDMPAVYLVCK